MFDLPISISIQGVEYSIRNQGDYRMVLDCLVALQDIELEERERIITSLIIFYDTLNLDNIFEVFDTQDKMQDAIKGMYNFFNCGQKNLGNKSPYKLIDWEQDSQLIAAAVNTVANTEIRSIPYLHWWTFMGYYISVGESVLSSVVSIRGKLVEGKKLEKHETEFRRKNPEYFVWNKNTVDQQEADAYVRSLWDSQ